MTSVFWQRDEVWSALMSQKLKQLLIKYAHTANFLRRHCVWRCCSLDLLQVVCATEDTNSKLWTVCRILYDLKPCFHPRHLQLHWSYGAWRSRCRLYHCDFLHAWVTEMCRWVKSVNSGHHLHRLKAFLTKALGMGLFTLLTVAVHILTYSYNYLTANWST